MRPKSETLVSGKLILLANINEIDKLHGFEVLLMDAKPLDVLKTPRLLKTCLKGRKEIVFFQEVWFSQLFKWIHLFLLCIHPCVQHLLVIKNGNALLCRKEKCDRMGEVKLKVLFYIKKLLL